MTVVDLTHLIRLSTLVLRRNDLMSYVIAVSSGKGGSGKTTTALHLSYLISKAGKSVLLVDADPQGSSLGWAASRDESDALIFTVVSMPTKTIHRDLPALAAKYDYVVIDSPPREGAIAKSAIISSDLVLMPVSPSSFDLWSVSTTIESIIEAQMIKPQIKAIVLVSKALNRTKITSDIKNALNDVEGAVILKATIGQRVIYAESASGYTAFELDGALHSKHTLEWRNVERELLDIMEVDEW